MDAQNDRGRGLGQGLGRNFVRHVIVVRKDSMLIFDGLIFLVDIALTFCGKGAKNCALAFCVADCSL